VKKLSATEERELLRRAREVDRSYEAALMLVLDIGVPWRDLAGLPRSAIASSFRTIDLPSDYRPRSHEARSHNAPLSKRLARVLGALPARKDGALFDPSLLRSSFPLKRLTGYAPGALGSYSHWPKMRKFKFYDLRATGIDKLFCLGYSLRQVAAITSFSVMEAQDYVLNWLDAFKNSDVRKRAEERAEHAYSYLRLRLSPKVAAVIKEEYDKRDRDDEETESNTGSASPDTYNQQELTSAQRKLLRKIRQEVATEEAQENKQYAASVLSDPYNRHELTSTDRKRLRMILQQSRKAITDKYLGYSLAKSRVALCYNAQCAPTPEELYFAIRSVWPSNEIVLKEHELELLDELRSTITRRWLTNLLDPIATRIRSMPRARRKRRASKLGFDWSGEIWLCTKQLYAPGVDVDLNDVVTKDPQCRAMMKQLVSTAVNRVRNKLQLSRVGEGWVSETDLYNRVRAILTGERVVQHGRPKWLGQQHFDIWIPERNIAIEYQGQQHFLPVGIFGGEKGLEYSRARDLRKKQLCRRHGVKLIEIAFDVSVTNRALKEMLRTTTSEY